MSLKNLLLSDLLFFCAGILLLNNAGYVYPENPNGFLWALWISFIPLNLIFGAVFFVKTRQKTQNKSIIPVLMMISHLLLAILLGLSLPGIGYGLFHF